MELRASDLAEAESIWLVTGPKGVPWAHQLKSFLCGQAPRNKYNIYHSLSCVLANVPVLCTAKPPAASRMKTASPSLSLLSISSYLSSSGCSIRCCFCLICCLTCLSRWQTSHACLSSSSPQPIILPVYVVVCLTITVFPLYLPVLFSPCSMQLYFWQTTYSIPLAACILCMLLIYI